MIPRPIDSGGKGHKETTLTNRQEIAQIRAVVSTPLMAVLLAARFVSGRLGLTPGITVYFSTMPGVLLLKKKETSANKLRTNCEITHLRKGGIKWSRFGC